MQSLRNRKEIQNLHIFLSVETGSADFRRAFGTKIQVSAARQDSAPHTRLYIIIQKGFEHLLIASFLLTAKIGVRRLETVSGREIGFFRGRTHENEDCIAGRLRLDF